VSSRARWPVQRPPQHQARHHRPRPGALLSASIDDAIEKLQYDLYYVKNNSLFLDLLILIDTVQVVVFGKGSR
jgi:lipopolysaccharide/colanic/teichoic acid biosynthesis glycosyltransferase